MSLHLIRKKVTLWASLTITAAIHGTPGDIRLHLVCDIHHLIYISQNPNAVCSPSHYTGEETSVPSVLIESTQLGLLIWKWTQIFLVQKLVPVLSSSLVRKWCFTVCEALSQAISLWRAVAALGRTAQLSPSAVEENEALGLSPGCRMLTWVGALGYRESTPLPVPTAQEPPEQRFDWCLACHPSLAILLSIHEMLKWWCFILMTKSITSTGNAWH